LHRRELSIAANPAKASLIVRFSEPQYLPLNASDAAHTAVCAAQRHSDPFAARTLRRASIHLLANPDEEMIRDCEDRHRGNGAYGERAVPVLAFRHRAYCRGATGPLRDGDQTERMHGLRPLRLHNPG
jgi:hypothetical protein